MGAEAAARSWGDPGMALTLPEGETEGLKSGVSGSSDAEVTALNSSIPTPSLLPSLFPCSRVRPDRRDILVTGCCLVTGPCIPPFPIPLCRTAPGTASPLSLLAPPAFGGESAASITSHAFSKLRGEALGVPQGDEALAATGKFLSGGTLGGVGTSLVLEDP